MSITITITKRLLINGVLTDADAAVLRDSTVTYGVKRHDTNEVIVAAGTAMAHESTGVYTYEFAAVAGVTYDYVVELTRGGSVYRAADQVTAAAAVVDAPSYLDVAEADAIAATLMNMTAWNAAADQDKALALAAASADVDALRYQGRKYDPAQALEFPRLAFGEGYAAWAPGMVPAAGGCGNIWDWNDDATAAVVPAAVERAVVIQAADRLEGTRLAKLTARWGLASQSIGGAAESYIAAAAGSREAEAVVAGDARRLLERYRLRSGELL